MIDVLVNVVALVLTIPVNLIASVVLPMTGGK
jgi:hypothetical protein